jgi:TonB family protein
MTNFRSTLGFVVAVVTTVLIGSSRASAQDRLEQVKGFYAAASYEEALGALTSLHGAASATESVEVSVYEVLCLVALGRADDARQAIEKVVRADPGYQLTEGLASPRVRGMFDAVRRPLLPELIRDAYGKGRDAFGNKDNPTALAQFDRVIALVAELEPTKDQSLRDLSTIAAGFRDLARLAVAESEKRAAVPAPAAAVVPAPPPVAAPAPLAPTTAAAVAIVKPPTAISQALPPWRPETDLERRLEYQGSLALTIDESGRVASAAIVKSVHPRYDPLLIEAARRWTYRPATREGQPIRFEFTMAINLVQR